MKVRRELLLLLLVCVTATVLYVNNSNGTGERRLAPRALEDARTPAVDVAAPTVPARPPTTPPLTPTLTPTPTPPVQSHRRAPVTETVAAKAADEPTQARETGSRKSTSTKREKESKKKEKSASPPVDGINTLNTTPLPPPPLPPVPVRRAPPPAAAVTQSLQWKSPVVDAPPGGDDAAAAVAAAAVAAKADSRAPSDDDDSAAAKKYRQRKEKKLAAKAAAEVTDAGDDLYTEFFSDEIKDRRDVKRDSKSSYYELPSERYSGAYDHERGRLADTEIVVNYRNASRTPEKDQVSIITQLSCTPHGRLLVMQKLMRKWNGPASVAVFIMNDGDKASVTELYDNDPLLRKHVSLHLVYMSDTTRTHPLMDRYGIQMVYPINTLRNVAWDNVRTDWILHVDVDFTLHPPNESYYTRRVRYERGHGAPKTNKKEIDLPEKTVFVIAAFEIDPDELRDGSIMKKLDVPMKNEDIHEKSKAKHALSRMYADRRKTNSTLQIFAQNLCTSCHEYTWYDKWFSTAISYGIEYGAGYEPYTIVPFNAPRYDEWFTGRHLNKNVHAWDLACDDYLFVTLAQSFVLHANKHKIIPYVKSDYDLMEANWLEHQASRWGVCTSGLEFNRRFWSRELKPDYWRRRVRDRHIEGRHIWKLQTTEERAKDASKARAEAKTDAAAEAALIKSAEKHSQK
jgi:hypothetical protein